MAQTDAAEAVQPNQQEPEKNIGKRKLRAVEPAIEQTANKPLTLAGKLLKIMTEVGNVPKNGWNDHHKYQYVREADLVEAIRGLLEKYSVMVLPSMVAERIDGTITTITMKYTIIDVDTGEREEVFFGGQGADKGDKGIYKAFTGAGKYFTMKTFNISTNDDPEGDADTDKRTAGGQNSGDRAPISNGAVLTVLARYYGVQEKVKSDKKGKYKAHVFVADISGSRENVQMFTGRDKPSQANVLEDIKQDPKCDEAVLNEKGVPCELDIKRNGNFWDVEVYRARAPQSSQ